MRSDKTIANVRQHCRQICSILKLAGVDNVYLFGSMARGDADESSDVDLLLGDVSASSANKLAAARLELELLLGRPVDLVHLDRLPPHIRETALKERIPLHAKSKENFP